MGREGVWEQPEHKCMAAPFPGKSTTMAPCELVMWVEAETLAGAVFVE